MVPFIIGPPEPSIYHRKRDRLGSHFAAIHATISEMLMVRYDLRLRKVALASYSLESVSFSLALYDRQIRRQQSHIYCYSEILFTIQFNMVNISQNAVSCLFTFLRGINSPALPGYYIVICSWWDKSLSCCLWGVHLLIHFSV